MHEKWNSARSPNDTEIVAVEAPGEEQSMIISGIAKAIQIVRAYAAQGPRHPEETGTTVFRSGFVAGR